jgi:tetratricopeptide (TPR) repeat protein
MMMEKCMSWLSQASVAKPLVPNARMNKPQRHRDTASSQRFVFSAHPLGLCVFGVKKSLASFHASKCLSLWRSLILIFVLTGAALAQETALQKADRLYADRDKVESLRQAVTLVEKDIASYEAMWRLAKFRFYLADHESDKEQKSKMLQSGIAAAERAVKLDPKRVEGHFWLGATKGQYADLKGGFAALGLVKTVRKEFEMALSLDPNYAKGSSHLALGQMLIEMPKLLGGSDKKGLEYLESGLQFGSLNAELKLYLAQQYSQKGRREEAKKLLAEILKEDDPLRTPNEQTDLRTKAQQQLDKLK